MTDKKMVHIIRRVTSFGERPDDATVELMKDQLDQCLMFSKKWPRVRFVVQHIHLANDPGVNGESGFQFVICAGPDGESPMYRDHPDVLKREIEAEPPSEWKWPFAFPDDESPCNCGAEIGTGAQFNRQAAIDVSGSDPGHLCTTCISKNARKAA